LASAPFPLTNISGDALHFVFENDKIVLDPDVEAAHE
jgi:hypothetical protein